MQQEEKFAAELIAPCGMNCGICVSFFGYTIEGKKRKHTCVTCRLRSHRCMFLKKQCNKIATKQIKYCFECTDFPCTNLRALDNRYRKRYGMSMIENLNNIKENGIKRFLKSEKERWKCPRCGGIICVHNGTCYSCNQTPEARKNLQV
jgi:hypothetical protein